MSRRRAQRSSRSARQRFAEHCAEHIASSLNDPRTGFVDAALGFVRLVPADLTVLVRDREEGAAIRRALQRRRIASVYLSDQDSVFQSPEASDLRHWLRAVADPMDGRLARVAYATRVGGICRSRGWRSRSTTTRRSNGGSTT